MSQTFGKGKRTTRRGRKGKNVQCEARITGGSQWVHAEKNHGIGHVFRKKRVSSGCMNGKSQLFPPEDGSSANHWAFLGSGQRRMTWRVHSGAGKGVGVDVDGADDVAVTVTVEDGAPWGTGGSSGVLHGSASGS